VATVFFVLKTDIFGFTKGTIMQADDRHRAIVSLLNAGLAVAINNPGGTVPVLDPDDPRDPALTAGAQAATVGAAGDLNDLAGSVTATALGVGMAAGALVTVTFTAPRKATPRAVLLSDRSTADAGLFVSAKDANGFTISCRAAPAANQAFVVDYAVID
jgi:hypothetical protein